MSLSLAEKALADFDYADFTNSSSMSFVGDASAVGSELAVTQNLLGQAGAAWHAQAQMLDGGFTTDFLFQMSGGADGMAFVIQGISENEIGCLGGNPCGTSTLHGGSFLAYEGIPSVAVEFDAYDSGQTSDPNGNHISVHTLGTMPNSADENTASIGILDNPGVNLSNGQSYAIRIEYTPGELRLYLDDFTTPALIVALDLEAQLGSGPKWCGFTAATGGISQSHIVSSWSMTTASAVDEFVRGDCNNDGGMNLPDVIFILGFLFPQGAIPALPCADACDCDDNGTLNLSDVITQLAALFGAPPVPLPAPLTCGEDPTTMDALDCADFQACP